MGVHISCCTTNEEKLPQEDSDKPEMHKSIVYSYPNPDVKPIQYLPRSFSNSTLAPQ